MTPLWMPKGSVRALVFLGLVGTFCYGFVIKVVDTKDFIPMVTLALGYYFGQKVHQKES